MSGSIDARLDDLGIVLPEAAAPVANYVPFVHSDRWIHISGQITLDRGDVAFRGRLGDTLDTAAGVEAARLCAINLLAQLKAATGNLDRVRRVVKLNIFVAATADFTEQPQVANGASDLMVAVFGDAGRHARAAVGVASLPLGVAVEVDGLFEIE